MKKKTASMAVFRFDKIQKKVYNTVSNRICRSLKGEAPCSNSSSSSPHPRFSWVASSRQPWWCASCPRRSPYSGSPSEDPHHHKTPCRNRSGVFLSYKKRHWMETPISKHLTKTHHPPPLVSIDHSIRPVWVHVDQAYRPNQADRRSYPPRCRDARR